MFFKLLFLKAKKIVNLDLIWTNLWIHLDLSSVEHLATLLRVEAHASITWCGEQCCHFSCVAARSSRFFSLLAGNFSIKQLAGFPAGFWNSGDSIHQLLLSNYRLAGLASNEFLAKYLFQQMFRDENFYTFIKNHLPSFWRFILGNTKTTRHN